MFPTELQVEYTDKQQGNSTGILRARSYKYIHIHPPTYTHIYIYVHSHKQTHMFIHTSL